MEQAAGYSNYHNIDYSNDPDYFTHVQSPYPHVTHQSPYPAPPPTQPHAPPPFETAHYQAYGPPLNQSYESLPCPSHVAQNQFRVPFAPRGDNSPRNNHPYKRRRPRGNYRQPYWLVQWQNICLILHVGYQVITVERIFLHSYNHGKLIKTKFATMMCFLSALGFHLIFSTIFYLRLLCQNKEGLFRALVISFAENISIQPKYSFNIREMQYKIRLNTTSQGTEIIVLPLWIQWKSSPRE